MITLVLGGARSGKSELAERLAARLPPPVTYVATMLVNVDDDDPDVVERVRAHKARRPAEWSTVEVGDDLAEVLRTSPGTILLDSLGTWLAAHDDHAHDDDHDHASEDVLAVCRALQERPGDTVVVSEEVGLGVHPSSPAGRKFRDDLGALNQAVAAVADEVLLVVAGRPLRLDAS